MLPLYILLTLTGVGYYLSKNSIQRSSESNDAPSSSDTPSMNSVYDSDYSRKAEASTQALAALAFQEGQEPYKTGVISKNYRNNNEASSVITSRLSGVELPKEEFTHNNMVPFFGGSIKQSLNENASSTILSNYTGVNPLQFSKQEVETFSDQTPDNGNVYGMSGSYQFAQDRMYVSRLKTNQQPAPMNVGPGLNQGYSADPVGGFQQTDAAIYAQGKTIDELRVATKPQVTYEGRMVDGQFVKLPAQDVGEVSKNKVNTYFEMGPDRYFTTVGANTKDKERPEQLLKCTAREVTSTESYQGGAYAPRGTETRPDVQDTVRQNLEDFGVRNANTSTYGTGEEDDYSRKAYVTYTNARDLTACRTYEGNLVTAVKSWIAPFTDVARSTTKEYTVAAARTYGSMSIQIPSKLTIYDPNDVARTTIKETLIHDEQVGNVKGSTLLTVYDPDEIARVTTRETMPTNDSVINVRRVANKGKVHDPNDVARTTTKETTIDDTYQSGPNTTQAGNAYITTEWDAKMTQKQFLSDNEYQGDAYRYDALVGAYENEVYDMKATQKQFTSDNDYYGTSKSFLDRPVSTTNYDNAVINHTKELLEKNRDPTQNSVKLAAGKDTVQVNVVKRESNVSSERLVNNRNHITNVPVSKDIIDITKNHKSYPDDGRLDPGILKAFKENPYTQSLHSTY